MIVSTKSLFQHAYGHYAVAPTISITWNKRSVCSAETLGKSKSNADPINAAKSGPRLSYKSPTAHALIPTSVFWRP